MDSPHHWGSLHLRVTNLSTEECEAIFEGLKVNNDNVEWLNISSINISSEGLAYIIGSLKTKTRISQLYFHGNPDNDLYNEHDDDDYLVPVPAESLVEVLRANKSVRELSIIDSITTDHDVKTITDGLKMIGPLNDFSLRNNLSLTIESAYYLSELIKLTKTMKKLSLGGKAILDDEWAVLIASAMKVNRSLKKISTHDSQTGDDGVKAFLEPLAVNQTLTSLGLFDTQITDVGANALANGLKHNTKLESFSIRGNQFSKTTAGSRAMLKAKNETLKYLYLD